MSKCKMGILKEFEVRTETSLSMMCIYQKANPTGKNVKSISE